MKRGNLEKWSDISTCNNLLFFSQLVNELLFDYSIPSNRISTLNSHYLCLDALSAIEGIDDHGVPEGTLKPIMEELYSEIKKDPVSSECLAKCQSNRVIYQNATHTTVLEADALAAIRGVINAGRPCIVYMQNASGGSHGVVCYGYEVYSTNLGYIYYHYIFNPSYAATSAGKTTIESYMANWWISGIHVYYN